MLTILDKTISLLQWVTDLLIWLRIELAYRTLGEAECMRQLTDKLDTMFAATYED